MSHHGNNFVKIANHLLQCEECKNRINHNYLSIISSGLAASLLLCSFFKCFFGLVSVIFLQYIANVAQRTFGIVQKN